MDCIRKCEEQASCNACNGRTKTALAVVSGGQKKTDIERQFVIDGSL